MGKSAVNMLLVFCLLALPLVKTSATLNLQGENELSLIHEEISLLKNESRNQKREIANLRDENLKQNQEIALLKDENRNQNKEISLLKESLTESIHHQNTIRNPIPLIQRQEFEDMTKASHVEQHIEKRPARLLPSYVLRGKKKNETDEIPKVFYGPPSNCSDLAKLGYTLNGFYLVRPHATIESNGTDVFIQPETVYCEFKQPESTFNVSKVEKRLGQSNIFKMDDNRPNLPPDKIRFYAMQLNYNDSHINDRKIVKFDEMLVNFGKGFNLNKGIFTAPKSGVYQFFVQGKLLFQKSDLENKYVEVIIGLYQNKNRVEYLAFDTRLYSFRTTIARITERTLKVSKGDRIYLKKVMINSPDDVDLGTGTLFEFSFSGVLLDYEH